MGRFEPNANLFAPGTISPNTSMEGAVGIGLNLRRNWDNHTAMEAEIEDRKYTREMAAKGQRIRQLLDTIAMAPDDVAPTYVEALDNEFNLNKENTIPLDSPEKIKDIKQFAATTGPEIDKLAKLNRSGEIDPQTFGERLAPMANFYQVKRDPTHPKLDPVTMEMSRPVPTKPLNAEDAQAEGNAQNFIQRAGHYWAGSAGRTGNMALAENALGAPARQRQREEIEVARTNAASTRMNAETYASGTAESNRRSREASMYEAAKNMAPGPQSRAHRVIQAGLYGGEAPEVFGDAEMGDVIQEEQDVRMVDSLSQEWLAAKNKLDNASPEAKQEAETALMTAETKMKAQAQMWKRRNPSAPDEENPFNLDQMRNTALEVENVLARSTAAVRDRINWMEKDVIPNLRGVEAIQRAQEQLRYLRTGELPTKSPIGEWVDKAQAYRDKVLGEKQIDSEGAQEYINDILHRVATGESTGVDGIAEMRLAAEAAGGKKSPSISAIYEQGAADLAIAMQENQVRVAREEQGAQRRANRDVGMARAAADKAKTEGETLVKLVEQQRKERQDRVAEQQRNRELDQGDYRNDTERMRVNQMARRAGRRAEKDLSQADQDKAQREADANMAKKEKDAQDALERSRKIVEQSKKASQSDLDIPTDSPNFTANVAARLEAAQAFDQLLQSGKRGQEHADTLYSREQQDAMHETNYDFAQAQKAFRAGDTEAMDKFYASEEQKASQATATSDAGQNVELRKATERARTLMENNPEVMKAYQDLKSSLSPEDADALTPEVFINEWAMRSVNRKMAKGKAR